MTTTITIKDKSVNKTYQNVTGITGGAGADAVFDVTKTEGVYTAILDSLAASAGRGFVAGDTITVSGTDLGGLSPTNDLVLTVATVGALGKIATFGGVGIGRVGDGTVDVQVDVTVHLALTHTHLTAPQLNIQLLRILVTSLLTAYNRPTFSLN